MAKRSSKRPYGVRYHWVGTDIKGTDTFHSEEDRQRFIDNLNATARSRKVEVTITTYDRTV